MVGRVVPPNASSSRALANQFCILHVTRTLKHGLSKEEGITIVPRLLGKG